MKRNEPNIELQKAWDSVYENMEDNIALMLLVLHNEYGFGRERIAKILDSMTDMAKAFDEYQADEVLEYKREKLTKGFLDKDDLHKFLAVRLKGVIPEEYYDEFFCKTAPSNYEMRAKYKRNTDTGNKPVSVAEAAEAQKRILAMKDFCIEKGIMSKEAIR